MHLRASLNVVALLEISRLVEPAWDGTAFMPWHVNSLSHFEEERINGRVYTRAIEIEKLVLVHIVFSLIDEETIGRLSRREVSLIRRVVS